MYYFFPTFMSIAICSLCTLIAYFANNMDPDQTAPLGALVRLGIWIGWSEPFRPPDKNAYWKTIFFISHLKHVVGT